MVSAGLLLSIDQSTGTRRNVRFAAAGWRFSQLLAIRRDARQMKVLATMISNRTAEEVPWEFSVENNVATGHRLTGYAPSSFERFVRDFYLHRCQDGRRDCLVLHGERATLMLSDHRGGALHSIEGTVKGMPTCSGSGTVSVGAPETVDRSRAPIQAIANRIGAIACRVAGAAMPTGGSRATQSEPPRSGMGRKRSRGPSSMTTASAGMGIGRARLALE